MTYRKFVQSRINPKVAHKDYLQAAAMGLAGEAGEFIDCVKKHLFQGHPLNPTKLVDELGDILFYAEWAAIALNIDLNTVRERNRHKLEARFPKGFKAEDSINREEKE